MWLNSALPLQCHLLWGTPDPPQWETSPWSSIGLSMAPILTTSSTSTQPCLLWVLFPQKYTPQCKSPYPAQFIVSSCPSEGHSTMQVSLPSPVYCEFLSLRKALHNASLLTQPSLLWVLVPQKGTPQCKSPYPAQFIVSSCPSERHSTMQVSLPSPVYCEFLSLRKALHNASLLTQSSLLWVLVPQKGTPQCKSPYPTQFIVSSCPSERHSTMQVSLHTVAYLKR